MSKRMFLLLALVFTCPTASPSQVFFERTYGGDGWDRGWSVRQTIPDSGYILAGTTGGIFSEEKDVWLIKTDASGDTLWTRRYGGDRKDEGYSVQQTSDGGYVIAGSTGLTGTEDIYLIRTESSGDTLWTRTFGGIEVDEGYAVQQTPDGGFIVTGKEWDGPFGGDTFLMKTDPSGDTLWTRTYGMGLIPDEGRSVQQTEDGGYVIAGSRYSFITDYDVYLVRTDSSGDTIWTRAYGGSYTDQGYSVQETADGGYVIAGYTGAFLSGDVYLIRTDSSGDTLWTRTFGGDGDDRGYSVQETTDGGYVIAGYTDSFGTGGEDVYLIKTDLSGNLLWSSTFGGDGDDRGYSIQQTADGGFVIAGGTGSIGDELEDAYLIKTNLDGLFPIVGIDLAQTDLDDDLTGQSSGNGDGLLNPGETIELTVWLENMHFLTAHNVHCTLGTQDTLVSLISDHADYGDIAVGERIQGDTPFVFRLSGNAVDGDRVSLELLAADSSSNTWGFDLEFRVHDINIDLYNMIIDDSEGGDGDRFPEAGENVDLVVALRNEGTVYASEVWAEMSTSDPFLSIVVDSSYFGDIAAGFVRASDPPYTIAISQDANDTSTATITMSIHAIDYYEEEQLQIHYGPPVGITDNKSPSLELPRAWALAQNYPNPFNPSTTISFDVPGTAGRKQLVNLTVYDIRGRRVRILVDSDLEPGTHKIHWDGRDDHGEPVSSGIYLYTLKNGDETHTRKMILLK